MRYLVTNQSWIFTKTFSLQSDFLDSTQFTLHFDQVDTVSNITLNDCYLGNTVSMYFAYTFNVSKSCLKNENTLHVDFMSPVTYALQQAIAYNQTVLAVCTGSAQHGECHINFIRKEPCSFSWDWVSYILIYKYSFIFFFGLGSGLCTDWYHRRCLYRRSHNFHCTIKT